MVAEEAVVGIARPEIGLDWFVRLFVRSKPRNRDFDTRFTHPATFGLTCCLLSRSTAPTRKLTDCGESWEISTTCHCRGKLADCNKWSGSATEDGQWVRIEDTNQSQLLPLVFMRPFSLEICGRVLLTRVQEFRVMVLGFG